MKIFPALFGNESLKRLVGDDLSAGRQTHAYILEGPDGSGRHTAAEQIAAALLCENRGRAEQLPCGVCPKCRKMQRHLCPDYHLIGTDGKASVGVDAIRQIKTSLYLPPNDGDYAIYVIENADLMTTAAQNSLLLSLEEPPPFVMFLLLVNDSQRLLPTVRSRAPVIRMQVFAPAELTAYLLSDPALQATCSQERLENAAALAGGSVGAALAMLTSGGGLNDGLRLRAFGGRVAEQLLSGSPAEGASLLSELMKDLGKKREDVRRALEAAFLAIRDYLAVKKSDSPCLVFYRTASEIEDRARSLSTSKILSAADRIKQAMEDLASNGNIALILSLLLLSRKQ